MDITAPSNSVGEISIDVSAYLAAYDLSTAAWQSQVRRFATDAQAVLEMSTANGRISYAAGVISINVPSAAMPKQPGPYVWDFGFVMPSGDFIRVDGGTFTILAGVTQWSA